MKFLFILCAIMAYVEAREISKPPQIIGGTEAELHEFPWQASLRYRSSHFCGGSLIAAKWILTAGHCLYNQPEGRFFYASEIVVNLGGHNLFNNAAGEMQMGVAQVIPHDDYEYSMIQPFHHDIGLLKLAEAVTTHSQKISTIKLAQIGMELNNGEVVVITGWGGIKKFSQPKEYSMNKEFCGVNVIVPSMREQRKGGTRVPCGVVTWKDGFVMLRPNILQKASVPVVKNCYAAERVICVGNERNASCSGDSGGPMVKQVNNQWVQFGLTSYGQMDCSMFRGSSKYTKVNDYIKWIKSKTNLRWI